MHGEGIEAMKACMTYASMFSSVFLVYRFTLWGRVGFGFGWVVGS